jgi:hypothetical protein
MSPVYKQYDLQNNFARSAFPTLCVALIWVILEEHLQRPVESAFHIF